MMLRAALGLITTLFLNGPSPASAAGDRVPALRVIETPAAAPGDAMAVLYSGDGGWGPLDRGVAKVLARDGVPVLGVNSLRYFLTRRSPQSVADDLADQLRRHQAQWGRQKIVLIGYSFGADALPAIVPLLPADLRAQVKAMVLIGTGPDGDLAFHLNSWLNRPSADSYPVAPAIAALKGLPMTCIYGDKERDDICASLSAAAIHQVKLAGGHHFNGDYEGLGRAVLRAASL
jgi:type IV secretory pathway VirJ component